MEDLMTNRPKSHKCVLSDRSLCNLNGVVDVLSFDEGEIRTAGGTAPISEVEVELYSGDQDDMIALGKELAAKYNLTPGNKSKYQRGLELLGL